MYRIKSLITGKCVYRSAVTVTGYSYRTLAVRHVNLPYIVYILLPEAEMAESATALCCLFVQYLECVG